MAQLLPMADARARNRRPMARVRPTVPGSRGPDRRSSQTGSEVDQPGSEARSLTRCTARPPATGIPAAERCVALGSLVEAAGRRETRRPPAVSSRSWRWADAIDSTALPWIIASSPLLSASHARYLALSCSATHHTRQLTGNQEYSNIGVCLCSPMSRSAGRSSRRSPLPPRWPPTSPGFSRGGPALDAGQVPQAGRDVPRPGGPGGARPELLGRRLRGDVLHRDAGAGAPRRGHSARPTPRRSGGPSRTPSPRSRSNWTCRRRAPRSSPSTSPASAGSRSPLSWYARTSTSSRRCGRPSTTFGNSRCPSSRKPVVTSWPSTTRTVNHWIN